MQVFKAFFKTVKKQSTSLIIYFVIFVALAIMLTNNGKSQYESAFTDAKVKIAVIDKDNTTLSKSIYNYLDKTETIVSIKDDKESISDELFYRNVEYVLIIKKGFEDNITAGKYEGIAENVKVPQSISGQLLDNKINQYMSALTIYMASGYTDTEAAENALDTSAISANVTIHQISKNTDEKSSTYYYYSFIPYILICILTVGLGGILITFRETNLNARIKCSAMSITKRNMSLIISSILLSVLCWACFIIMSFVLYQTEIFSQKGILFIGNSFVFLLVAISLTYLVSFFVHTPSSLNMISNILGLGLSFLGGVFVPLEYMSKGVVTFAKFLPTYWYVTTNSKIDAYTTGMKQLSTIISNMGIELVFALTIFAMALAVSKFKRN